MKREKVYRFRNWVAFERINMIKSLTRDDISNLTKERKIIGPELRFLKIQFWYSDVFSNPFKPGHLTLDVRAERTNKNGETR